MTDPKHQTIKVWYSTYRELKKLAAEKPESIAALIDRLVRAEQGGLFSGRYDNEKQPQILRDTAGGNEK